MDDCRHVKAPRVAASPCSLECKVTEIFRLKDMHGVKMGNILTIGQVVGVHLDEFFILLKASSTSPPPTRSCAVAMRAITRRSARCSR